MHDHGPDSWLERQHQEARVWMLLSAVIGLGLTAVFIWAVIRVVLHLTGGGA